MSRGHLGKWTSGSTRRLTLSAPFACKKASSAATSMLPCRHRGNIQAAGGGCRSMTDGRGSKLAAAPAPLDTQPAQHKRAAGCQAGAATEGGERFAHLEGCRSGCVVGLGHGQVDRVAAAAQHVGLCVRVTSSSGCFAQSGRRRDAGRGARRGAACRRGGRTAHQTPAGPCGWMGVEGGGKQHRERKVAGRTVALGAARRGAARLWCRSACCWGRSSRGAAPPAH
jgi:hypothetical protein